MQSKFARHTVPDVGERKGPAAIKHEEQVVLIIKCKSDLRTLQAMTAFTVQRPVFTAVGVRLRTCSALIVRWLPPLLPFLPPVLCSSLYAAGRMSTWSCQTWTRVHERAWGRKKIGFFSVISRSGTVSCTLVWGSSRIGARGWTMSVLLPWHSSKDT